MARRCRLGATSCCITLFAGAPRLNEVVFLHRRSRTLLLTDLAFNVQPGASNRARIFHWLVGATGRFGPHRLVRTMIRDRAAARALARDDPGAGTSTA